MKVVNLRFITIAVIVSLGLISALSNRYNLRGGVSLESLTCKKSK
jgi:hypothetical protein